MLFYNKDSIYLFMQLDKVDKKILNTLLKAGCERLSNISKQVHKSDQKIMSHTGVAKRISKREDAKILKIQGNLSVESLNYNSAIILMEVKNYEEVSKEFF